MGMIKGIAVTLIDKVETGKDLFETQFMKIRKSWSITSWFPTPHRMILLISFFEEKKQSNLAIPKRILYWKIKKVRFW
ncbi:hypothetical protein ICE98_03292 [Lactococcus lactis]|nr:hypothetical protein [Lactococcus lactis]